ASLLPRTPTLMAPITRRGVPRTGELNLKFSRWVYCREPSRKKPAKGSSSRRINTYGIRPKKINPESLSRSNAGFFILRTYQNDLQWNSVLKGTRWAKCKCPPRATGAHKPKDRVTIFESAMLPACPWKSFTPLLYSKRLPPLPTRNLACCQLKRQH